MMERIGCILLGIILVSSLTVGVALAQKDVQGSKDHPLVTRMPDFYISKYDVSEFAGSILRWLGARMFTGKGSILLRVLAEGKWSAISMLQIVRNYETAIKQAGGKILGGDDRRVAAEIRKGGALTGIYVEAFNEGRDYSLTIVGVADDAAGGRCRRQVMRSELADTGKTIVSGIYFDTASATIKLSRNRP